MTTSSVPTMASDRGRLWLGGVVLVLLATLPFAGSVTERRLWDDSHYVFDNPTLKDRVQGVARIWAGEFLMDYYPVPQTVLWAEYGVFGQDARGYRVANIALHAASALAVWWAAVSWRLPWPWLVAAVWSCHPVQCDVVCWISQHKSTVGTIFFAVAAALAAKPAAWLPLAVLAHGLACLSKTDAVTLPAVLVALELWRRRSDMSLLDVAYGIVPKILPFAGVSLVTAAGAARFMATRVVTTPIDLGSPVERMLKAGWAVCFYIADVVWPVRLAAAYPVPVLEPDEPAAWLPLVAVGTATAGLTMLAWRCRPASCRAVLAGCGKSHPWPFSTMASRKKAEVFRDSLPLLPAADDVIHGLLAAAGAFVAMLLPVLMILPQGYFRYSLVADRYLHLPLLAPVVLVAAGGAACTPLFGRRRTAGIAAFVIGLCVVLTARHAVAYRSEEALWRAAIVAQPEAWYPYHGLGTALLNEGNDAVAAIPFLESAAARHGVHPVTWFNLGLALIEAGRPTEARAMLVRAVTLEPDYMLARRVLAELDRRHGAAESRLDGH